VSPPPATQAGRVGASDFKKSDGVFCEGIIVKYQWIRQHRSTFSVKVMCDVLKVSDSGYYDWLKRKPSPRFQRTEKIHEDVRTTFEQSGGIYGARKIAEVIEQQNRLKSICRNTASKAMREMGLRSCVAKAFKPMTTQADLSKTPAPNVLDQDFQADGPNCKWVTDITYLSTGNGWVYLVVVLDLFSRKIVGWSISQSLATDLVADALRQAIESRQPGPGLIHHSDRGCQYTSDRYQSILRSLGVTVSMSRKGCCYDNAVCERFFWSLKNEWTNHRSYANLKETRQSVFQYIELFYNQKRIHQALGYMAPNQFEADNAPVMNVA
jgi:putative transposase